MKNYGKEILIGLVIVVFNQLLNEIKMNELSEYWRDTLSTLLILGVVYYLYFRLKLRITTLKNYMMWTFENHKTALKMLDNAHKDEEKANNSLKILSEKIQRENKRQSEKLNEAFKNF